MLIQGLIAVGLALLGATSAEAITIYPLDRAAILTAAQICEERLDLAGGMP